MLLGLLLGLCQWVKFGGGAIACIAILAIDGIWLLRVRPERVQMQACLRGLATMLAMAAVMEVLFAGFVLTLCPPDVARDAIWPTYMIGIYEVFTNRWPALVTWKVFFTRQLLPLSCLALGIVSVIRDARLRFEGDSGEGLGAYVGLVFFCAGLYYILNTNILSTSILGHYSPPDVSPFASPRDR